MLALTLVLPAVAVAQPRSAPTARAASASPSVKLASHRAVYDVSLVRASQRDDVRSAHGTMTYTLTDQCDGYTIESAMRLDMGLASGDDSELEQHYASWEAKNNRLATFRMLTRENGAVKESYQGEVKLDANGAGTAVYHSDKDTTYELPEGTLLSTNHLIAVLDAGLKGEHMITKPVIDGSFDDGPYRVGVAVGPERHVALSAGHTKDVVGGVTWPLAMAYFRLDSDEDTPEYEVMMKVGPNGVAQHLVQDFGGFTLAFNLVKAELVAGPPC